jgi:hypothetical protein
MDGFKEIQAARNLRIVEFVLGTAPTYTSHNRRPLTAEAIDALEPGASTDELVELVEGAKLLQTHHESQVVSHGRESKAHHRNHT